MTFTVASNSFKDGDYLPSDFILSSDFGFGCAGRNRSPHLKWSGTPEGTKSFAVTCYDPDASTGSGFWHWLLANIPANVSELADGAGSTGGALQTRTDFGVPGYGGRVRPRAIIDKLDVKGRSFTAFSCQGAWTPRHRASGLSELVVATAQWQREVRRSIGTTSKGFGDLVTPS
jgi:phosphatidylethanolamine-binding protein